MIKIAPSILSANSACLCDEVKKLEQANADYIHFDVMDGHFVNNITFGPKILSDLKKCTNLEFDVHLMVENPLKFIPWYINAGADIVTFHFEAVESPIDAINLIKSHGIKVGISIKPNTDVSVLIPYLDMIDLILIMSVEPGFGGQTFISKSIEKITKTKELIKNKNILIEVDGGINVNTAKDCINSGVDILVAGTAVFSDGNYKKNILSLKGEI
ncbi:MAG: ribulose-phosphate 3-epimerase [Alphaproteobacteria bacterium]|nr:ribulose-phosphate 3-epimerase [Alphaproteobacteria bacterium]